MLTPILRTVLPSDCFACGRPLEGRQRMGACLKCWASLDQIEGLNCRRCGAWLPIGSDLLGPWPKGCAHCLRQEPIFGGVLAAGVYRGSSRLFLLRGKLAGRPEILRELGRRLAVTAIVRGFGTGCTAGVPVPSHPWARWTRGFNPAEEISRALARTLHQEPQNQCRA